METQVGMDGTQTRCAVIGFGMGKVHARHFASFDDVDLVAVSDVSAQKRAEALQEHPGIEVFEDFNEMLATVKPEVVSIALPNFLHKPVTVAALRAGCHVLCEKPMAMTVAEAKEMQTVAEAEGRILGINLSQLSNPMADTLRRWVSEGALGEVYHAFVSWTRQNDIPGFGGWFGQKAKSGGGPLIDLGVHRIGLMLHALGNPRPVRVSGFTQSRFGVPRAKALGKEFDVEDFAGACVRFENGTTLFVEVSWDGFQKKRMEAEFRMQGDKGTIRREEDGYYLYSKAHGNYTATQIEISKDPKASSYRAFIEHVRRGTPYDGSPALGIHLQQILNAIYESAALGHEIAIEGS